MKWILYFYYRLLEEFNQGIILTFFDHELTHVKPPSDSFGKGKLIAKTITYENAFGDVVHAYTYYFPRIKKGN